MPVRATHLGTAAFIPMPTAVVSATATAVEQTANHAVAGIKQPLEQAWSVATSRTARVAAAGITAAAAATHVTVAAPVIAGTHAAATNLSAADCATAGRSTWITATWVIARRLVVVTSDRGDHENQPETAERQMLHRQFPDKGEQDAPGKASGSRDRGAWVHRLGSDGKLTDPECPQRHPSPVSSSEFEADFSDY